MRKSVTIFRHTRSDGSCLLGKILEENGFDVKSITVSAEDISDFDPLGPDLLMVMGGAIGVYQAEDYPFIYKELEILRARLDADKPTFGICLGAQMIARALGADVYKGKNGKEAGWHKLKLLEAGKDHPVRHLCAPNAVMFHWHGDTFDMPGGTTLLATTDKYKQIFSYGKNTLALQCHTEVQAHGLKEWWVSLVDLITGPQPLVPIEQLRRETDENIGTLNAQTRKFFTEWLKQVELL